MEQGTDSVRLVSLYLPENSKTHLAELAEAAWLECVELREQSQQDFVAGFTEHVQVEPRYEVLFYVGDTLVGGASLTLDRDPHVGECANVVWQYVLPAYRNRGISRSVLRQARRLAVLSGVSTYSYTHRTGDYSYSIRYRRVR